MRIFDFFNKKQKQAFYNPFNIQDDPSLKKYHQLPDLSSVIKTELSNIYMYSLINTEDEKLKGATICSLTEDYTISLIKSYYDNAKIVPMCIVNEIVKQVYDSSRNALGKPAYNSTEVLKQKVLDKVYQSENDLNNLSSIITLARKAVNFAQKENVKAEIETLVELYNEVQKSSSQLLSLTDYNIVGSAYFQMSKYNAFMKDEDIRRVIADNAFYCFSKALERKSIKGIHFMRLAILAHFHNDFYFTIANALNLPEYDYNDIFQTPLIIRTNKYYYDIALYDFQETELNSFLDPAIEKLYRLVNEKVGYYDAQSGKQHIDKIVNHLESIYKQY